MSTDFPLNTDKRCDKYGNRNRTEQVDDEEWHRIPTEHKSAPKEEKCRYKHREETIFLIQHLGTADDIEFCHQPIREKWQQNTQKDDKIVRYNDILPREKGKQRNLKKQRQPV